MCFGSRTNPEFSTGVNDAPRPAHHYLNIHNSNTSSTNKPAHHSGGFVALRKAMQEKKKAGEIKGVQRPT